MKFEFTVGNADTMRWVTYLTCGGVAAAVGLAIMGGFPLDTPMPTHSFGWVEPTCGLTRGSTAITRGDFLTAWRYNPASFLVMAFGIAGTVRTIIGVTSHRWVNLKVTWSRAGLAVVAAACVLLWAYQQTNAEFIINSRV